MKPLGMFERMTMAEAKAARLEAMLFRQAQSIQILQAQVSKLSAQAGAEVVSGEAPQLLKPAVRRMADIAAEVATENLITLDEIMSKARVFRVCHPRQEAMLRMVEAGFALSAIGRFFRFDHTTVMHGVRAAKERRAS